MDEDDDLMGLSDAEIAALGEDDDEDDTPVEDAFGDDEDEGEGEQEAAADDADPAPAGDEPAQVDPAAHDENAPLLMPVADLSEITAALAEVAQQKADLRARYNAEDSSMTSDEYEAEMDKINDRILDLRSEQQKAEMFSQMNDQMRVQAWQAEIRAFMKVVAKDEGIDYRADEKLLNQFDLSLKVLGNDPANADKTGEWFLTEAHEMVKARNRLQSKQERREPQVTAVEKAIAERRAKATAGREIPRTLAHVPQAAIENEGGGEFAHLDKLSGMDLEMALARMTPEQEQRWLNS